MRTIIVGAGIQGRKRREFCGTDFVSFADPNFPNWYAYAAYVPQDIYDAACVCTPSNLSYEECYHLINKGKHVLVEKPLWAPKQEELVKLQQLADERKCVLYTAYNHRFEPSIKELKSLLRSGSMGKVYYCRIFYGNGTAQNVKNSPWRDDGIGIFGELGSHLLDLVMFLFDKSLPCWSLKLKRAKAFENKTPDFLSFGIERPELVVECEATYLSWKNTFTVDVLAENGSIHINGLCKWGPCRIEWRKRVYPSGVPESHCIDWSIPDPTWKLEYDHFKFLCQGNNYLMAETIKDREINYALNTLMGQQ